MSDVELVQFKEDRIVVTIFIEDPSKVEAIKDVWENQVESCQPPLVGAHKNAFTVFIPWILKESKPDE